MGYKVWYALSGTFALLSYSTFITSHITSHDSAKQEYTPPSKPELTRPQFTIIVPPKEEPPAVKIPVPEPFLMPSVRRTEPTVIHVTVTKTAGWYDTGLPIITGMSWTAVGSRETDNWMMGIGQTAYAYSGASIYERTPYSFLIFKEAGDLEDDRQGTSTADFIGTLTLKVRETDTHENLGLDLTCRWTGCRYIGNREGHEELHNRMQRLFWERVEKAAGPVR
jgi:hypothetical protein